MLGFSQNLSLFDEKTVGKMASSCWLSIFVQMKINNYYEYSNTNL